MTLKNLIQVLYELEAAGDVILTNRNDETLIQVNDCNSGDTEREFTKPELMEAMINCLLSLPHIKPNEYAYEKYSFTISFLSNMG